MINHTYSLLTVGTPEASFPNTPVDIPEEAKTLLGRIIRTDEEAVLATLLLHNSLFDAVNYKYDERLTYYPEDVVVAANFSRWMDRVYYSSDAPARLTAIASTELKENLVELKADIDKFAGQIASLVEYLESQRA